MHCVILHPKETTRNVLLALKEKTLPSVDAIGKVLRRSTAPEHIGSWKWNALTLHLFAYKSGKAGTENKHELPPPHDTILLFGEALLCATQGDSLISFDANMFKNFYNELNGGFDDLDEDEDDEEEDEEEEEEEEEEAVEEEEEVVDNDIPEDDEEEAPPVRIVKITKSKKASKKIPAWFSLDELKPEEYSM